MATKKKLLQAAAGVGGAALNIEEVFSTYLYTGTGSTLNIVNGIDLNGEGGMVWHKYRGGASDHGIFDTERGVSRKLTPNDASAQTSAFSGYGITAFNSNGYTLGTQYSGENGSGNEVVSWTFRKAPKFFTCLTYTGDGVAGRSISHDLGSTPAFIVVKRTDSTGSWYCWHTSLNTSYGLLESTSAFQTGGAQYVFGNSTSVVQPTSSAFTVGTSVNASSATYVAYLFAHNDGDGEFGPTGDQDIIKCGSYTGNGSSTLREIDLGFEPQWVVVKRTDSTSDWAIMDNMRGALYPKVGQTAPSILEANTADSDTTTIRRDWGITANGIGITDNHASINASGGTYIYIAIRRGPMAVPESATDVFDVNLNSWADSSGLINSSITPDTWITTRRTATGYGFYVMPRITGGKFLETWTTDAEGASAASFDLHDGVVDELLYSSSTTNLLNYFWKRAPNYFDVVAYTGDATASPNTRNITHNLGVAPEMMWIKCRSAAENWAVYHSGIGATKYMNLNNTNAAATSANWWGNTAPTDTVFTIGHQDDVNLNGGTHIAYLFASLDGVSKVGSASHTTGSNTDVDCGFSAGARFVILKGTDASGWQVFDTERGIVTGNDPKLTLHSSAAEGSSQDSIDPYSSGFSIGPDIATGTYIFYAIA